MTAASLSSRQCFSRQVSLRLIVVYIQVGTIEKNVTDHLVQTLPVMDDPRVYYRKEHEIDECKGSEEKEEKN